MPSGLTRSEGARELALIYPYEVDWAQSTNSVLLLSEYCSGACCSVCPVLTPARCLLSTSHTAHGAPAADHPKRQRSELHVLHVVVECAATLACIPLTRCGSVADRQGVCPWKRRLLDKVVVKVVAVLPCALFSRARSSCVRRTRCWHEPPSD